LVGAAATVGSLAPLVPAIAEPVRVAVMWVVSPAWLLGCHAVETAPVLLVKPEVGVKDVVNPAVGYAPEVTVKVTGTPGCVELEVAVTVMGAVPAVYEVVRPVTVIVGATSV
jgi:hypothetical protein